MRQILAAFSHILPSHLLRGGILAASLALPVAAPLAAQDSMANPHPPLVVVELFTSQGCSSCPPADEMMTELAGRDDVLPLSLHVDYWDYIGWRDNFAKPEFTLRQKAYAHAVGKRTIYTPQLIVQGADHLVGAKPMRLVDLIMRHRSKPAAPVSLSVSVKNDQLHIVATPTGALPPLMRLQVVRFDPHERVVITRGENAGRDVEYSNIVTEWRPLADWNGAAPLAVSLDLEGPDRAAVILQAAGPQGPGPILAAVRAETDH
ncbi:DUF1223 domain-containing protein [Celeribacter halophilus]|jgi:hypothetical protein|uniref:DUF1223 domain-containing protein n=1 Tax=Celeribacter halophilus TaxID=576117 RepID=A0AAW7XQA5_9RHOB|nr:DUF1223 domain-containing protein [Celeribacter halophilus]MDO6455896.1 DUF1223 domain-containing protein [Celeribacter halophilus]MDO6722084.1 DUF1223 domain-containing protein [Celeribacter halophilus]